MSDNDTNVERVRAMLAERSARGVRKYGVTTERGDLSVKQWLTHAQEEALDLAVYLEVLKRNTSGIDVNVSVMVPDSTVPEVVLSRFITLRMVIYKHHHAAGGLHVVLDDFNVARETVAACVPETDAEREMQDLLLSRTLQERHWLVGLPDEELGFK